jgi:hypothetical protein
MDPNACWKRAKARAIPLGSFHCSDCSALAELLERLERKMVASPSREPWEEHSQEIISKSEAIIAADFCCTDCNDLCGALLDLDEWIRKGGFLPSFA